MKILSYNLYGIKKPNLPFPSWEERQKNIYNSLTNILKDEDIKVLCFQEVNENNIKLIIKIINENGFVCLEKFPMITESIYQYNIVAVKSGIKVNNVYCLPHGKDMEYKNVNEQVIDYEMSDYRTTVFVEFKHNNKKYLIGNTHTDYISTEGKIKGIIKSLNYMDKQNANYKFVVGDMNMVCHMSEVYNILKQNSNYTTLSRSTNFDITDNSWHGYGAMEQVNVDFAFIEKSKKDFYDYKIIKQDDMLKEGSDHRPIIIEIIK